MAMLNNQRVNIFTMSFGFPFNQSALDLPPNLSSKKFFPGFTTVNMVDLYIYSQMDLWFINLSHYT